MGIESLVGISRWNDTATINAVIEARQRWGSKPSVTLAVLNALCEISGPDHEHVIELATQASRDPVKVVREAGLLTLGKLRPHTLLEECNLPFPVDTSSTTPCEPAAQRICL